MHTFTPHRVAHELVVTRETIDHYDGAKLTRISEAVTSNAIEDCPDCGRGLQRARDGCSATSVLVCPQLEGLDLHYLDELTGDDVVACGEADDGH